MKKIFLVIVSMLFTICAFAAEYTAQCKMNDKSYVVASQDKQSTVVKVTGYGDAANATVIVTVKWDLGHATEKYTVTIKNGYGEVKVSERHYLVKVENIVCY